MNQQLLLAAVAMSGAGTILAQDMKDALRYIAVVFAAVNLFMTMNVLKLAISGVPTALVLGAGLAICGVLLFVRTQGKLLTASSTVLVIVGALKILTAIS